MPFRLRASHGRRAAGIIAALAMAALLAPPASAEGFFESIFGGRAPRPPLNTLSFADPFTSLLNALSRPRVRSESGPTRAFCVRTCDGRYFPIQAHAGTTPSQTCQAFCPASQTLIFAGGSIDHAVAGNGTRYADLANAFVYRERLVPGCTCNGRDEFGVARLDARSDPTLRPGDIVAGRNGLAVFHGGRNKSAEFTPVQSFAGFSKSYREKLSELKIMPPNPGANDATPVTIPPRADNAAPGGQRQVQLSR